MAEIQKPLEDTPMSLATDGPKSHTIENSKSQPAEDVVMTDADSQNSLSASSELDSSSIAQSCLFQLPLELRERIWFYCLSTEQPIVWPSGEKTDNKLALDLLRTCKPVHNEASLALYEYNTLHFRHPSDCNMFLYVHHIELSQRVRTLLLHINDRDVSLWTGYLSSTSSHRSLLHDYPCLEELYIVLRSSVMLSHAGHDITVTYKRWQGSNVLGNLCGCLQQRVDDGVNVKILFARFAIERECQTLMEAYPDDFQSGDRARTKWAPMYGSMVALDATQVDNPWYTGALF